MQKDVNLSLTLHGSPFWTVSKREICITGMRLFYLALGRRMKSMNGDVELLLNDLVTLLLINRVLFPVDERIGAWKLFNRLVKSDVNNIGPCLKINDKKTQKITFINGKVKINNPPTTILMIHKIACINLVEFIIYF